MKKFAALISLFIFVIIFTFCAMKQRLQTEFPQEIKSVCYPKDTISNQDEKTHLYIEFIKPLASPIKLEKIYFQNQTAVVVQVTTSTFVAHFKEQDKNQDLILDSNPAKEYGNKAPIIAKSTFDLKRDEAVLEYKNNNKTQFFKITNIIEKTVK